VAEQKTAADSTVVEPTVVERWLTEQQQWQRTVLTYLDSMVKNDDFLVHLGNAMRGSLLAGKPYPTAPAADASAPPTPADDRLDRILFELHKLEGQIQDLRMSLDEVREDATKKRKDRTGKRKGGK
jgi:hypothetical protein